MPEIAPKLYTVTRDVEMLVQRWCRTRPEGQLAFPPSDVFKELSDQLTAALIAVFAEEAKKYQNYPAFEEKRERGEWSRTEVEFISPEQIRKIISKRDSPILSEIASGLPWITLDRAYCETGQGLDADYCLEVTRLYDLDGCVKIGLGMRPESETLDYMGTALGHAVEKCVGHLSDGTKVVLADDGLYSGSTMAEVVRLLKQRGIQVRYIITALTRKEGAQYLDERINDLWASEDRLTPHPRMFLGMLSPRDEVRDWVCERDFFVGVPLSGRTVGVMVGTSPIARPHLSDVNKRIVVGIPYSVVSTNDLQSCASISSGAYTISRVGLELSLRLWKEMEKINGDMKFRVKDLPRTPVPLHKKPDAYVVAELEQMLGSIT
jgi:hypothetical protein